MYTFETPAFRNAVETTLPNSTAALLYKNFPGVTNPTYGFQTLGDLMSSQANGEGWAVGAPGYGLAGVPGAAMITDGAMAYADPCFLNLANGYGAPAYSGGPTSGTRRSWPTSSHRWSVSRAWRAPKLPPTLLPHAPEWAM